MSKADILRQLQAYKKAPDKFKELSPTQLAELVLPVLRAVETIDQMLKEGRLDGKTPEADKDYLSLSTAKKGIEEALNRYLSDVDRELGERAESLEKTVLERISALRDGENGLVTEEEIQRAAQLAFDLIELPDFDALITERFTANPEAIRDSLELLQGDERLDKSAVKGLDELESDINQRIGAVAAGGVSRNTVRSMIEQYGGGTGTVETIVAGSGISVDDTDPANPIVSATGGGGTADWGDIGGTLSDQTDLQSALNAKQDASSAFSGDYDDLTNKPTLGNLAALDSVTTSQIAASTLVTEAEGISSNDNDTTIPTSAAVKDYVDDAIVAGGGYTDEQAQDAVGSILTDSSEIDFTYDDATPSITASLKSGSIDETKLDASVNASLDLADSAVQTETDPVVGAVTGIVKADGAGNISAAVADTDYQSVLSEGAFADGDKTKLDGIEALADVTDAGNVGAVNAAATSKATPVNADSFPIVDSEASNVIKRLTFTNLKAFLKTYFDTLYQAAGSYITSLADLGVTATSSELNVLDGITSSTAELNILDGVTATASELNTLDGITASVTELNYTDGVTSAIQTQLDGKVDKLADPNADRIRFWDDSAGAEAYLTPSTGLTISGTNMTVRTSSATQTGIVELATDAETVTGTDTTRAATPANITARLAAPGTIGGTTPGAGTFTTVTTTGNIELGHASDTTLSRAAAGDLAVEGVSVLTTSNSKTVTNKRVQPRTASSTTSSTLTPDLSSANVYYRTTQTEALTINAPTGTPVIGEVIAIYVDSAGAQTLTMNATYIPFGAAFPATTTAGKTLMITAQYNGTNWNTLWAVAV